MEEQRARDREREDRILTQLQNQLEAANGRARPAAEPVRDPMPSLPRLSANAPLEPFIAAFKTQFRGSGVAEDQWKYHLIGPIDDFHWAVLADCMTNEDSTHDNLVRG